MLSCRWCSVLNERLAEKCASSMPLQPAMGSASHGQRCGDAVSDAAESPPLASSSPLVSCMACSFRSLALWQWQPRLLQPRQWRPRVTPFLDPIPSPQAQAGRSGQANSSASFALARARQRRRWPTANHRARLPAPSSSFVPPFPLQPEPHTPRRFTVLSTSYLAAAAVMQRR